MLAVFVTSGGLPVEVAAGDVPLSHIPYLKCYGCDDEQASVPADAALLPTNFRRILPALLHWKINATSD